MVGIKTNIRKGILIANNKIPFTVGVINILRKSVKKSRQTGCWIWQKTKNSAGYGVIGVAGKVRLAHRIAYEMYNGPIADGLVVRHFCDNPSCINPQHLLLGTYKDNARDRRRDKSWTRKVLLAMMKVKQVPQYQP